MIIHEQIYNAIDVFTNRSQAFSVRAIAEFGGWHGLEREIDNALRYRRLAGELLVVQKGCASDNAILHLSKESARTWWAISTIRWALTGVDHISSDQLGNAMSVAFDNTLWNVPPSSLLRIGLELGVITEGQLPETYVLPWTSLARLNECFLDAMRVMLGLVRMPDSTNYLEEMSVSMQSQGYPHKYESLLNLTTPSIVEWVLGQLSERQATVIKARFGLLDKKARRTLEDVGRDIGVSRERVRQIEAKALKRVRSSHLKLNLCLGFLADFARSGGSLVLSGASMTQECKFLLEALSVTVHHVARLDVYLLADGEYVDYQTHLANDDNHAQPLSLPKYISKHDANQLRAVEELYWEEQSAYRWSRPRMLLAGLRSLGRAAHFQEIAEECNRLFPARVVAARNWHSALNLRESAELGIAWIGRKGMYGLEEHGYFRPKTDIFEAVAAIVNRKFSETRRPVATGDVFVELSKERRELHASSVNMALSFNDKLESVGSGMYVPVGCGRQREASDKQYDFAAAFAAFSASEEEDM